MATSAGKTRITITLGNAVLEKIDAYCAETGMTRSAAITSIVGSNLGFVEQMRNEFAESLKRALQNASGQS